MLNGLKASINAINSGIEEIKAESEGVYLTMGRVFPSLLAETGNCIEVAENAISGFGSAIASDSGRSLDEMGAHAKSSGEWFHSLHDQCSIFLERINKSIASLSALDGNIQNVRSDSEEMEIISLNALTVALKSGMAGKAFSVITDELKRLSSQTISLTDGITSRGESLLGNFELLRDSLRELDAFQEEFFGSIEDGLTSSIDELHSRLAGAEGFFSGLIDETRAIRAPVTNIMHEVQLQDIVRQSLEHVAISLGEAEGAASSEHPDAKLDEEEVAFIAAIADLSASLIVDIVGKLDSSASSFEVAIDEVEVKIGRIEARRLAYISGPGSITASGVGQQAIASGAARYLGLKKAVITSARRLAEQVEVLGESFKGLTAILGRFKNIVVASRIEVAKNKSLAGVHTTVRGMMTLTERIEEDVSGSMKTTMDFIKIALEAIDGFAEEESHVPSGREAGFSASSDSEDLPDTLQRIEADIAALGLRQNAMSRAIEGFILFTPEFLACIAESRSELNRLKSLAGRLRVVEKELRVLEDSTRRALTGQNTGEIHSERLKLMIERFTIFSHKQAAGIMANFSVEKGVSDGDVTFF